MTCFAQWRANGPKDETIMETCESCDGTGTVLADPHDASTAEDCPDCDGSGETAVIPGDRDLNSQYDQMRDDMWREAMWWTTRETNQ